MNQHFPQTQFDATSTSQALLVKKALDWEQNTGLIASHLAELEQLLLETEQLYFADILDRTKLLLSLLVELDAVEIHITLTRLINKLELSLFETKTTVAPEWLHLEFENFKLLTTGYSPLSVQVLSPIDFIFIGDEGQGLTDEKYHFLKLTIASDINFLKPYGDLTFFNTVSRVYWGSDPDNSTALVDVVISPLLEDQARLEWKKLGARKFIPLPAASGEILKWVMQEVLKTKQQKRRVLIFGLGELPIGQLSAGLEERFNLQLSPTNRLDWAVLYQLKPDLILLEVSDENAPNLTYLELLRLDAQMCKTRIICFTPLTKPKLMAMCYEKGADDCLTLNASAGMIQARIEARFDKIEPYFTLPEKLDAQVKDRVRKKLPTKLEQCEVTLVIENPVLRQQLMDHCHTHSISVLVLSDISELISSLGAYEPLFKASIILLEQRLEQLSQLKLLSQTPIPVRYHTVLLSRDLTPESIKEALINGIKDVIQYPVEAEILFKRLPL
jgi:CheY-like chemotaxis protein